MRSRKNTPSSSWRLNFNFIYTPPFGGPELLTPGKPAAHELTRPASRVENNPTGTLTSFITTEKEECEECNRR
jgi:hypothetical protein